MSNVRLTCLALAAVSVFAFAATAAHGTLLAHYNMEETSSPLTDQAGGQTAAAVDVGHQYSLAGPAGFGNAVGLNGNGSWQLSVADSAELGNLTNNFTVASWVYLDSAVLATKSGLNSNNNRVMGDDLAWDGDGFSWGIRGGQMLFTKNGVVDAFGPAMNTVDQWVHLAVTVSSTTGLNYFINGVNAGSDGNTADLIVSDDPYAVGRSYGNLEEQWFGGRLDEVRVYDTVLSDQEIGALAPGTPVFEVNRNTGGMTFTLPAAAAAPLDLLGYSITSPVGALDPSTSKWTTVAGNYDVDGDGSVDGDDPWTVLTHADSRTDLSEAELVGGNGGQITAGQSVNFGSGDGVTTFGPWIQNPTEDVQIELLFTNGSRTTHVGSFVGNGDESFDVGDLNFDGTVDAEDWPTYLAGYRANLSGLSGPEAYQMGDLNGDGVNDVNDFGLFKEAFEAVQGLGSFDAMLAGVPEPASWMLLLVGGTVVLSWRRSSRIAKGRAVKTHFAVMMVAVAASLFVVAGTAHATLIAHYNMEQTTSPLVDQAGGQTAAAVDAGHLYSLAGPGSLGNAVGLNGNGSWQLSVADSAELGNLTNNFTVASWVYLDSAVLATKSGLNSDNNRIMGDDLAWDGDGFAWGIRGGRMLFTKNGVVDAFGPAMDTVDQWVHLAVTASSTTGLNYFINGANAGSHGSTADLTVSDDPYAVGRSYGNGQEQWFGGHLDEVRVYDTVLSDEEIADLVLSGQDLLTLQVNTVTGATTILNQAGKSLDIDQYDLFSLGSSLDSAGWSSLQDQDFEGGGDPQVPPVGDGWEELGTPDSTFLAEAYLQGSSVINDQDSIELGTAYDTGVDAQDVVFTFRIANGSVFKGIVEYDDTPPGGIVGDFDNNGLVGQGDLDLVLLNWGDPHDPPPAGWVNDLPTAPTIGQDDLDRIMPNWGNTSGAGAASAVPEPSVISLAGLGLLTLLGRRRRR